MNREWLAMVEHLKRIGVLKTREVEEAFKKVDRAEFVLEEKKHMAYFDTPLPMPRGQTTSAPHIIALMIEILEINKSHKVLEIGTGSGYQTAILSYLAKRVVTIEYFREIYEFAKQRLQKYANVLAICGDGSLGYEKEAPYDRIIVSCAAEKIPEKLIEQLKDGGLMAIPIEEDFVQHLWLIKKSEGRLDWKYQGEVDFVPLISGGK
jgi:protein-L-isoaspartate(D-aspartate) O-methyltransferase